MNIVILGVGTVGEALIENLIQEKHDISVIDSNPKVVENIINKYDVNGFIGTGISHGLLIDAGIKTADFFIASTSHDEVNIISCVLAKNLGAKYTACRVRDPEYFKEMSALKGALFIDMAFNPEYRTAKEIAKILKFPSADNVQSFGGGKATMVEFTITEDNPMAHKSIMDIVKKYDSKVIFAIIQRENKVFIPRGDFIVEPDDLVSICAKDTEITNFCKKLHIFKMPAKSAFIIGGGKIGYYLAEELLSAGISVKIVDNNEDRCKLLSEDLVDATVLYGDGGDSDMLKEEGFDRTDACITLTGVDEKNAMISLYANTQDVKKVITGITRPSTKSMLETLGLDTIISPQEVIANYVLRFVRSRQVAGGGLKGLYKVGDAIEVLEFVVDENFPVGVELKDLKIRKEVLVGGIVRNGEYMLPIGSSKIETGDKVIIVAPARKITELKEIIR